MEFSVLMSVYKNTKLDELKECIESLDAQTVRADEAVIVADGPLSADVAEYLKELTENSPEYKLVSLEENVGLGNALREGMEQCSYDIIARMDTDDICAPDRFEKQIKYFEDDAELSVVGANILEFVGDISNVVGCRVVPSEHNEICEFFKKRDPFNHMTVFLRKSHVMKAGGYLPWHLNEDSYLWARMLLSGAKFANVSENLVYARIGTQMYARRGGYKYFKSEKGILKYKRKKRIINFGIYSSQVVIRFIAECVIPSSLRGWLYKRYLRKSPSAEVLTNECVG